MPGVARSVFARRQLRIDQGFDVNAPWMLPKGDAVIHHTLG